MGTKWSSTSKPTYDCSDAKHNEDNSILKRESVSSEDDDEDSLESKSSLLLQRGNAGRIDEGCTIKAPGSCGRILTCLMRTTVAIVAVSALIALLSLTRHSKGIGPNTVIEAAHQNSPMTVPKTITASHRVPPKTGTTVECSVIATFKEEQGVLYKSVSATEEEPRHMRSLRFVVLSRADIVEKRRGNENVPSPSGTIF